MLGHSVGSVADVDAALATTLRAVLDSGHLVAVDHPDDQRGDYVELIGYQVAIANARARITANPKRHLNAIGAVARFVWMVAGNNRLADIAFYEPKVDHYTDDHLSVPGSDYGMRLFQPRPGLNQIEGVCKRLADNPRSRRGAAVIWMPEDAVRESADIPCAFGSVYHVRDQELIATTMMRSNNAALLLNFNIFEFSMLAEMVAATLGIELGSYIHFAASMHVYESQRSLATAVCDAYDTQAIASPVMPPMPRDPSPLQQANLLAQYEADLRHTIPLATIPRATIFEKPDATLHPYWRDLYVVLACHAFARASRFDEARQLAQTLPHYFKTSVAVGITRLQEQLQPGQEQQLPLLPTDDGLLSNDLPAHPQLRSSATLDSDARLHSLLEVLEARYARTVTRSEFALLKRHLQSDRIVLAARSAETVGLDEALDITLDEVDQALQACWMATP